MKLSQLGEFGLIDLLAKGLDKPSARVVVGIGDDAAALRISNFQFPISNKIPSSKIQNKKLLLITTDTLVENVHFRLKNTSFFYLGYKALAINISDIAAMGGDPTFALVTIGANKNLPVSKIEELYRGIKNLARKYKIDIVGGDTVASPRELIVSITLLGEVAENNLLLRSNAKVGDAILVTGSFGKPAADEFRIPSSEFRIRLKEAQSIAKSGLATAMIDSSDGLVRSILEICKASKVGARIWLDSIPVAEDATLEQALYGGEEYELVFTVQRSKAVELKTLIEKRTGTKVSIVGEIVSQKNAIKLVDVHGVTHALKSGGYEHFR